MAYNVLNNIIKYLDYWHILKYTRCYSRGV